MSTATQKSFFPVLRYSPDLLKAYSGRATVPEDFKEAAVAVISAANAEAMAKAATERKPRRSPGLLSPGQYTRHGSEARSPTRVLKTVREKVSTDQEAARLAAASMSISHQQIILGASMSANPTRKAKKTYHNANIQVDTENMMNNNAQRSLTPQAKKSKAVFGAKPVNDENSNQQTALAPAPMTTAGSTKATREVLVSRSPLAPRNIAGVPLPAFKPAPWAATSRPKPNLNAVPEIAVEKVQETTATNENVPTLNEAKVSVHVSVARVMEAPVYVPSTMSTPSLMTPRPATPSYDETKTPATPIDEIGDMESGLDTEDGDDGTPDSPNSIEVRLAQREKQIGYGKNTIGYQNYIAQVPKNKRTRDMPRTPDRKQSCSKRSWDGQLRKWRRELHKWDPVHLNFDESASISDGQSL